MPASAGQLTVKRFFARNGVLARCHPNYEYRRGQLEMAEAVEAALADGRHLIVEAGTGTGKTLAYLVPAILSGRRVIISTGTKNLQEQLFYKDIPFLERHLGRELKVCYMKGRNNYACRQRIYDAEKEPVLEGFEEIADFEIIRAWEKTTESGDRAEIRTLAETTTVWDKLDARAEFCTGEKCAQFERCFITQMRRRAQESDLIVVNHHLLFADLSLKRAGEGIGCIPEYSAVIIDEAHEIEDTAGQFFGISVSNYQFEELRRDITRVAGQKQFGSIELDRILVAVGDAAARFFALFGGMQGRTGFRGQAEFLERHEAQYSDVIHGLDLILAHLQLLHEAPDEVGALIGRCLELQRNLDAWMSAKDRGQVYFVERRGRGTFLQAVPIDLSRILAEKLFGSMHAVILTSATLAVAGNFDYVQRRLGVENPRTLIVPGHFDYPNQALLYVPQSLPDPRQPGFARAAADEVTRILKASRGRAFVLFTSYKQMREVHDLVSFAIDYPALLQQTGPRTALLEEFRNTPNAVLFATASFWQGVDVPGEQLSCVIIDKLPFAVPNDPVVEARGRAIAEEGGDAFYEYQIPEAALALKQGFGRLIRSSSDRGVLALLDNRISKRRYGQVFFDSLPAYRVTTDFGDVESFFDV